MTNQLVSIVMPAYNAQDFIAESIDSVKAQTYANWELIIINDGSTDATGKIAEWHQSQDNRVKVIHQANKKLGAARNAGIKKATGDWIAFLDADDIWLPGKLEQQLHLAADKPDVGLIFTDGVIFYSNTEIIAPYGTVYGTFTGTEMYKLQYTGNYIPVLSVLIKREHIETLGWQDESPYLYGCEDWDYWLRLCLKNVTFYGMQEKLFRYRRHSANMSNNDSLMRSAKANVLLKNFCSKMLSKQETKVLKSFVDITICHFIKIGKLNEAQFLNMRMGEIFSSPLRRLGNVLMTTFKQQSYYLLRSVFKIEKLLYNPMGNV